MKLAEPKGLWVGTEVWLFEELRTFAGEAVYHSSDFPRTLDELLVGQPFAYVDFEAEGSEEVRELHHVLQL
jgi:hypothetical protein